MEMKLEQILEALLLSASRPLSINEILAAFDKEKSPSKDEIRESLKQIEVDCETRGVELKKVSSGYRMQVKQIHSSYVSKLWEERPQRLSKATLETLALIAYKQPITRGEIEEIRGVSFASNTLETLLQLDWVRPAGRKDVPGKPIQYVTTENFLNHFNIQKLSDLPTIDELGSAGLIDTSSIDKSIFGTGKFFKEQSISEKQNIYEDIDDAIKKAPEEEK